MSNVKRELAYRYGASVKKREMLARMGDPAFEFYDKQCLYLWRKMSLLDMYADEECVVLKAEWRTHYWNGLSS